MRIALDAWVAGLCNPTGVANVGRRLTRAMFEAADDVDWCVYLEEGQTLPFPLPARSRVRYRGLGLGIGNARLQEAARAVWQTWAGLRDRPEVTYSFSHLLPGLCLGARVITVHDVIFERYPDCYPPGYARWYSKTFACATRRARAIVVPSEATRRDVLEFYAVDPSRVHVVPWGVDVPQEARVVRPSGLPDLEATRFFLCVGRMDPRKNFVRVMEALAAIRETMNPPPVLVIAGPADHASTEIRAAASGGVHFTGYVEEDGLNWLYRNAVGVVYPSFAEGFGLPVVEAMANGAPVITSCVSALCEVAGDAALLVDPTSVSEIAGAMRGLLEDETLRTRLIADGRHRIAAFTWERSARILLDLFRAFCPGDGDQRGG